MEAPFHQEEPTMNNPTMAAAGTTLRQRLIDDMSLRRFGAKTQHDYIRSVSRLAAFLGRSPATATAEGYSSVSDGAARGRHARAGDEQRRLGAAFLLHHDARSPGSVAQAGPRLLSTHTPDGAEPGGGGAAARRDHLREAPRGIERGLWCRPAGCRGGGTEGRGYRQPADADSRRTRQRWAIPQRHALARPTGPAAGLVGAGQTSRRDAAQWLVVSGPEPGQSDHHPPVEPRCRGRGPGSRHHQARQPSYAAPQLRDAFAGGWCRYPRDPGPAGSRQAR